MKLRAPTATLALALALFAASVARGAPPPSASIERIEAGRPIEIYAPGENPAWEIVLRNQTVQPLVGSRLVWKIVPWGGSEEKTSARSQTVRDIAAGESVNPTIEASPALLGWHELVLELRDRDDGLLAREVRRFSVGSTPRSSGAHFRYGLCSHMLRHSGTPLFETELSLTEKLGVDIVRTELAAWESTEPSEGRFDFSKPDLMLAALAPTGIEIQPIFAYSTRWASTGDANAKDWNDWNKTAPRLSPWLTYVGKVVDRYGDRVRHWEIWNEPDISFWRASTAQYVELFDATSAIIKKKSSRAQVLNGGFAMVSRAPNTDFVPRFVASASPDNWDVFAYHDYHSFTQFLSRRAEVETRLPGLRKKLPLWINEGGAHTLLAGGERAQALTLVKKIASAPARGISAYFWYNLRDDGLDPKDPEHHFGLTLNDGQPKPAWSAYQALIRELGAARYLRSLPDSDIPAGVWAHLYRLPPSPATASPGVHVLVLWQEGASRSIPHWLDAGPGARVIAVRNLMGNPVDNASLTDHGAVLPLTEEPVYVQIQCVDGAEPALALRPLLDAPPLIVLVPGQTTTAALRVHNPLARAAKVQVVWTSNIPGLRLAGSATEYPVAARSHADASLTLALSADALAAPRDPRIALRLAIPEAGLALTAELPATLALPIPSSLESASRAAVVALHGRDDIHNLYSAEPLPEMQWHGAGDLSATVRLSHDPAALHIVAEVRDDLHRQTEIKDKLWTADSLQIGLRFDDTRGDYIEIGLACAEDKRVGGWVFAAPPDIPLARGRLGAPASFDVARDDARALTTYRLDLPWSELGQNGPPAGGFRLNLLVNDDDGRGRKQWVRLSEGLGEEKNPALWRVFTCQ